MSKKQLTFIDPIMSAEPSGKVGGLESGVHTSELVAGYRQAFVDSSVDADPGLTPKFVSNSNGMTVKTVIENELRECSEMFMSVAFVTSGGIAPFLGYFKDMERNNVRGRILTTDYLMFSEPAALDRLNSLSNIDVRMYRTGISGVGFHTKGYMFHNNGDLRILIGSSNLTQAAISKNHEWNTMMVSGAGGRFAKDVEAEFENIWNSSVSYDDCREEYGRAFADKAAERKELKKLCVSLDVGYSKVVEPNAMQAEFCRNVEELVRSGEKRALLISATGTGKTYASAFAVRCLFSNALTVKKKVLFLSHREQINSQALKSYLRVLGNGCRMELLSGTKRDDAALKRADFVFSTMQMMSKDSLRQELFTPDHFSVIILDECHRSGSEGYQKIISYFKPDFMLGMSASPERNDGFDIYEQFDHNIACEIRLQTALENDLLCPFHYFGITDLSIDGVSEDREKFRLLTSDERVEKIMSAAAYYGYSGPRVHGLIFCSNRREGAALSEKMNLRGYRTAFLSGDDSQEVRSRTVRRLVTDDVAERLDYILTVDIFNEGVDIPEINQVIMLRPTESAIVFVQQLGRGLRKADGKEYVVVLDFIGNYDSNYLIPVALSGDRTGNKDNVRRQLMCGDSVIKGASSVYFDEIAKKRIFASIDRAQMNRPRILKEAYMNLKMKLGRRPKLAEFDLYGELDPLRIIGCKGSYHDFLVAYDSLEETFDDLQKKYLRFISEKLASGKRPHELELLSLILDSQDRAVAADVWKNRMIEKYGIAVNPLTEENVFAVLSAAFYDVGTARGKYTGMELVLRDGGLCVASGRFRDALDSDEFRREVRETVDFGLSRYKKSYSKQDGGSPFVIGQKYTYEDVCRLLCWDHNEVALNIGGYKYDERTRTYPVFVNYDKSEDVSDTTKYEDRFVDRSNLVAISKSKRTVESSDVRMAVNAEQAGVWMGIFVRKNKEDKESKEFYYLGKIVHDGSLKEFTMPNTDATAVEIGYRLQTPVAPDLYGYLTSPC